MHQIVQAIRKLLANDPAPQERSLFERRLEECRREICAYRSEFIWKTVIRKTYASKEELMTALNEQDVAYKEIILQYPEFVIADERRETDCTVLTPRLLQFDEPPAYADVYERALSLGFDVCAPEVVFLLRLAYLNQPPDEILIALLDPIESGEPELRTGYPFTLALTRSPGRAGRAAIEDLLVLGETKTYSLDARFIFTMPRTT